MALRETSASNGRMRDPPPLRIDLVPSRLRCAFIVVAYAAAACVVGLLPLGFALRAWAVLLVAALAVKAWREEPPAALVVRLDGSLALLDRLGTATEGTLVNGGYLGEHVVTIAWRRAGQRRREALAILPDMLGADELRQLRVRLAYASSDDEAGAPASHARASTSAPLSALGWRPTRST
jgi:hypothetical protein